MGSDGSSGSFSNSLMAEISGFCLNACTASHNLVHRVPEVDVECIDIPLWLPALFEWADGVVEWTEPGRARECVGEFRMIGVGDLAE